MRESIAVIDADRKVLKNQDAVLPIYSITKTLIAFLILTFEIDLESTISNWIPKSIFKNSNNIKVVHLMNHSSGIRDYGSLPAYIEEVKNRKLPWSDQKFTEATINAGLLFEPGKGFNYSNPGYWLLKRILEIESGQSFDDLIEQYIAKPLHLPSLKVAQGEFDPSLSGYHAGWVWHGLVLANAKDTALFMASEKVSRLNSYLNKVETEDQYWQNPHYGLGLMIEPGIMYGHMGGGPGYEAACFKFLDCELCACAIFPIDKKANPLEYIIAEKESITRG